MVSLADVLAVEALDLRPVVTTASETPVRWVATSELADPSPYLEGGEILLTTGLETADWDSAWYPYVQRLASAGVRAIGLGVGLTHADVPAPLATAAAEIGLDLFVVPRPTAFVAISRAVAGLLERTQTEAAQMQRRLTRAAARSSAAEAVVAEVGGAVGGTAYLVDPDGRAIVGPDTDDATRAEVRRLRRRAGRGVMSSTGPAGTTVIHPVGLGDPRAYLAVTSPGRWSEGQRAAVLTAAALLSLEAAGRSERLEADRRLRGGAVALLLGGQVRAARQVVALARTSSALPETLRVVRMGGAPAAVEAALTTIERDPDVTAAPLDGGAAVVCGVDAGDVCRAVEEAGAHAGVGGVVGADAAAASDAGARGALSQCTVREPVVRWDERSVRGLAAVLERDRAAAFAAEVLGPLDVVSDGPTLLDTVRAFLAVHGQRIVTSERLGVHRNTVSRRVRRVEDLLGRSLDDPSVRADLWVALQVREEQGPRSVVDGR